MTITIGINGFGRIGRCVTRALIESGRRDLRLAAINSRSDINIAAHLLRHDSTHGKFSAPLEVRGQSLIIDNHEIPYSQCAAPGDMDWRAAGVHLALECSGKFTARADAEHHLSAGAQQVLVSAPSPGADATVVYGVNDSILRGGNCRVVSAASCTTNCLAPPAQILHDNFGIDNGWMTTIHAVTNDQKILDESHQDLRRARAAGNSIILTKTGAAAAVGLVIPALAGKLSGISARVPVTNVSLVDLTCQLATDTDADTINAAFHRAVAAMPANVFAVNEAPLVSTDFNHTPYSSIVDATQTRVLNKRLAKIMAWYDNEWGFACRMLDVAAAMRGQHN